LYKLRAESLRVAEVQSTDAEKAVEGKRMLRDRSQAQVQLVSDLCDFTIPAAALGMLELDDGIVGLAGTLSSILGLSTQWTKTA